MEPLLILYGSQTGNAEEIAKKIFAMAQTKYSACKMQCMKDYVKSNKFEDFSKINIVIFIVSTTGKGDPPDNARKFIRLLMRSIKKNKNWMRACSKTPVKYTILGLGDSNYNDFCNTAQRLEKMMQTASCESFYPIGLADDGTGLGLVVEPWIQGLFPQLNKLLSTNNNTKDNNQIESTCEDNAKDCHDSNEEKESFDLKPTLSHLTLVDQSDLKRTSSHPTLPREIREIKRPKIDNNELNGDAFNMQNEKQENKTANISNTLKSNIQTGENSEDVKMDNQISNNRNTRKITHPQKLPRYQKSNLCLTLAIAHDPSDEKTNYFVQRWMDIETERELKGYTPEAPFMATILGARFLTHPNSQNRRVIHMDIALPEDATESVMYVPGDAIGVYCPNDVDIVARLLKRLKLCGKTKIVGVSNDDVAYKISHITYPCTIADAFHYCVDITNIQRKRFLRMLAEWCSDNDEQQQLYELCSLSSSQLTKMQPTLLELLEQFPSCLPDLSDLLAYLPVLKPRYYSISCCQIMNPTTLQIAFTLVNYKTPKPYCRPRKGLCTHWLYNICQEAGFLNEDSKKNSMISSNLSPISLNLLQGNSGPKIKTIPACLGAWKSNGKISIPIFLRRSNDFCPPTNISKPVIMIGPGTGIAPFRGFLQQRQSEKENVESGGTGMGWWRGLEVSNKDEKKEIDPRIQEVEEEEETVGEMILFFGCRHPDIDFLYKDEIENFVDMDITKLYTAFSRLQSQKVYVQHRIAEQAQHVANLILTRKAQVFVCGDGTKMARDVMKCIEDVLHQYGDLTPTNAKKYVIDMIKNKRYIADIWS